MPPAGVAVSAWNLVLARVATGTIAVIRPAAGGCDGGAVGDPGRKVVANGARYPHADDVGGYDAGDG